MKVHESSTLPPRLSRCGRCWSTRSEWPIGTPNSKRCGAVGRPVYVGERFGTTYIMSKKKENRQDSEAEVLRCEPWTTLALRHRVAEQGRDRYVEETFQLSPRVDGAQTHVKHTVDFGRAGMPLWMRALMWFITRFGEPQGEGILEPLKRACEVGRGPAVS